MLNFEAKGDSPAVSIEEVVDSMKGSGLANLGRATTRVVNPVVGQGDLVVLADQQHGPVVLAVAAGTPAGLAVQLAVGNRNSAS